MSRCRLVACVSTIAEAIEAERGGAEEEAEAFALLVDEGEFAAETLSVDAAPCAWPISR